jgi:hypothetical protein
LVIPHASLIEALERVITAFDLAHCSCPRGKLERLFFGLALV